VVSEAASERQFIDARHTTGHIETALLHAMNSKPIHLTIAAALYLGIACASANEPSMSAPRPEHPASGSLLADPPSNMIASPNSAPTPPSGNDCFPGAYIIHFDDLNHPHITGGGGHCPSAATQTYVVKP
jgi:hypothetical protein